MQVKCRMLPSPPVFQFYLLSSSSSKPEPVMPGLLHTCTVAHRHMMAVAPFTSIIYCHMDRLLSPQLRHIMCKEIVYFIYTCNPSQSPGFTILLPLIPLQLSENNHLTKAVSHTNNWKINQSTKQNYRSWHMVEPKTLCIHLLSNAQP